MNLNSINQQSIKKANRQFYDAIAKNYEEIDGRRSPGLESWLHLNLINIRKRCSGGNLLDIGSGSGLVTRCSQDLFKLRVSLDISEKILISSHDSFDSGIVADIDHLPFAAHSFDLITCFSVLHHLYSFEPLILEVSRVLKPGGIFYSDHDLDKRFNERFHLPFFLYRRLHNAKYRYMRISDKITPELYNLTEWQQKGIDSEYLVSLFRKEGFSLEYHFHWFGLSFFSDMLFAKRNYSYGWAPLLSLSAVKKDG